MEQLHSITRNPRFLLNPPVLHPTISHPKFGPAVPGGSARPKGRCIECLDSIKGVGFKAKRKEVNTLRSICQSCGKWHCDNHLVQACWKCVKKL